MRYIKHWWYGIYLVPLIFLALFFFYPLLSILDVSLRPDGQVNLSGFVRLLTSDYYIETLVFTVYQALLSTILTIGLVLPGAYVLTRYQFRGKSLLLSLATLPFVLPTVVVAIAFMSLMGERGLLNDLLQTLFTLDYSPIQLERTLAIILIVHVFYNYSIALRLIVSYWSSLGTETEEVARTLGASELYIWRDIRLPLLRPALLSASILVFIFTFTSFGVVLILGGIRFSTLEVQIYYQAVNIFNLPLAGALSVVQIVLMLLMMIVYTRIQRQVQSSIRSARTVARRPSTYAEKWGVRLAVGFIIVLLFAPLVALILRSIMVNGDVTLRHYQSLAETSRGSLLFISPLESIWNSLRYAGLTTLSALVLGVISAYLINHRGRIAKLLDPVFMLPLATSAVTLGFGFIIALDEPPLNLRASWLIIPISHTLVALPFVIRSVLPALRAIPNNLREAAHVLGATPYDTLRTIDFPLLGRGLAVGATFAFTVSMGEFGASLFVAQREAITMPIVIFRLIGDPGLASYGQALAMSVVLMLVCAVGFVLIERTRTAGVGEF
jgi:thiamine transport system permease protein